MPSTASDAEAKETLWHRQGKMDAVISKQHASPCTVMHCLFGYYILGIAITELARIFHKSTKTVRRWRRVYERTGTYDRAKAVVNSKFTLVHREWLLEYYKAKPLSYIDEAQKAFKAAHYMDISRTTVWRIIHEHGLTWKVLERRAIQIKEKDIHRFIQELSAIDWSHQSLVFLDEVSFDNRGMIRKRGYAMKGKKLAIRGTFRRLPRVSVLAFLGVDGLLDFYNTEGTFDRVKFFTFCRTFAYSKRGGVRQYPGKHSVWILDGATIHRDPEIVHFLRSIGIMPIFLPAYCPFFNPIEFLFGYVKRAFQRHYDESAGGSKLLPFIIETMYRFDKFDMTKVFAHCGWKVQGFFDPRGPMSTEKRRVPDIYDDDAADEDETVDPTAREEEGYESE